MAVSVRGRQLTKERQEIVRKMYDELMSDTESMMSSGTAVTKIAMELGICTATVYADLKATRPKEELITNS